MGVPKKKSGGKKKPARAPQQLTAEEHYENAEMAFAMENLDLARTSFKRALELEPENVEYLEGYGSFLAEVGPRSEALAVLQKAAQLLPDEGFEKYMYLGQLQEGPEAEQCVRKGISILRGHIQQHAAPPALHADRAPRRALRLPRAATTGGAEPAPAEQEEEAAALEEHMQGMLSSALCSLVEVLMNQAQEKGAAGLAAVEGECQELLGEARGLAPTSPEPLQALASLRQQQGKEEEALSLLRQSLALWFKPSPPDDSEEEEEEGEAAAGNGKPAEKAAEGAAAGSKEREQQSSAGEEGSGGEEEEGEGQGSEMDLEESFSDVLEQLLDENDSDPNVWLLLALCCQSGGDLEGALGAAEEGISLCRKMKLAPDDETLAGFEAMQAELQAMQEGQIKTQKAAEAGKGGAAAEAK
ncbi:hypothetical protein CHLNCDRAFT_141593 [Chlorella variabilis]|uniref:Uncharacterized protein n=1 Tax=Chlorella variabilis TaxID=554065 RepID=E1ZTA1_CHLVA|nr:hypothetical protein CHLNCDRAFT_141593 [Chlorella variabilis]EFN50963.1 hypothetical protein CHLNCDRAFT_141593 [Chlorella variabilis]|eukprot:XP_005843065.1 hypothetical protein CHLNCDRAFT_141593 [Chlorella variabilis]